MGGFLSFLCVYAIWCWLWDKFQRAFDVVMDKMEGKGGEK